MKWTDGDRTKCPTAQGRAAVLAAEHACLAGCPETGAIALKGVAASLAAAGDRTWAAAATMVAYQCQTLAACSATQLRGHSQTKDWQQPPEAAWGNWWPASLPALAETTAQPLDEAPIRAPRTRASIKAISIAADAGEQPPSHAEALPILTLLQAPEAIPVGGLSLLVAHAQALGTAVMATRGQTAPPTLPLWLRSAVLAAEGFATVYGAKAARRLAVSAGFNTGDQLSRATQTQSDLQATQLAIACMLWRAGLRRSVAVALPTLQCRAQLAQAVSHGAGYTPAERPATLSLQGVKDTNIGQVQAGATEMHRCLSSPSVVAPLLPDMASPSVVPMAGAPGLDKEHKEKSSEGDGDVIWDLEFVQTSSSPPRVAVRVLDKSVTASVVNFPGVPADSMEGCCLQAADLCSGLWTPTKRKFFRQQGEAIDADVRRSLNAPSLEPRVVIRSPVRKIVPRASSDWKVEQLRDGSWIASIQIASTKGSI
jgi:hypothetical protein